MRSKNDDAKVKSRDKAGKVAICNFPYYGRPANYSCNNRVIDALG